MRSATFLEKCLNGDVGPEAIDDFVAAWHEGEGDGLGLPEFLGMDQAEFARWIAEPDVVAAIVAAHRGTTSARKRAAGG